MHRILYQGLCSLVHLHFRFDLGITRQKLTL
nr:MAG TPA: hypothetical protein [Caudoviricetes sp.]